MAIDVRTLSFSYGGAPVLQNVSFSARGGEVIALLGPNGVGKSTLFRCLLGFLKPQRGEVRIDGKALSDFSRRALAREIAYIPQSYSPTFNYTVRESVLMGVTAKLGALEGPTAAQQALVMQMLDQLGIAHLSERGSRKISGGERQLMLIARALVQNARVLIMDEPTANLDYGNSYHVMERVAQLGKDGYTVIFRVTTRIRPSAMPRECLRSRTAAFWPTVRPRRCSPSRCSPRSTASPSPCAAWTSAELPAPSLFPAAQ